MQYHEKVLYKIGKNIHLNVISSQYKDRPCTSSSSLMNVSQYENIYDCQCKKYAGGMLPYMFHFMQYLANSSVVLYKHVKEG